MSKQSTAKRFGISIQHLRKERGLTQSVLAKKSSLHTTFVSGVEAGDRNVTLETASKLARALGVPLVDLFAEHQSLKSPSGPVRATFLKLGGTWDMQMTREGLTGHGQLDDKAFADFEKSHGYDEKKILDALWTTFSATAPIKDDIAAHLPWVNTLDSLIEGDFFQLFSGDSSHYRPALVAPVVAYIFGRMRAEPDVHVLAGMGTDTIDVLLPFFDVMLFDKQGTLPLLCSGANLSFREKDSDAPQNFRDLALATRLPLQPGAYYIFNRTIYRGGDFVKVDPDEDPTSVEGQITFFSPHRTQARIGFLGEGTVRVEREGMAADSIPPYEPQDIYDALNRTVTVNLGDENDVGAEVERILDPRYPAVIVASHALGNASYPIRRAVIEAVQRGKLVLNVSRCITGNTSDRYYVSLSNINSRELKGTSQQVLSGGRVSTRVGKALLVRALLDNLDQRATADLIRRYSARTF